MEKKSIVLIIVVLIAVGIGWWFYPNEEVKAPLPDQQEGEQFSSDKTVFSVPSNFIFVSLL